MKKTLKFILLVSLALLICTLIFTACDSSNETSTPNDTSTPSDATTPSINAHAHDFDEWEIIKPASCSQEGSKERYCACGEKQTASISATGHNFGEWTIVKEATRTEKGCEERVCSCGEKETRDIDVLPVVTTVTKNEWKKAFDFSTAGKLSIYIEELCSDSFDDKVYGSKGTITVQNGTIDSDFIVLWGDEENAYQNSEEGEIYTFFDIGNYAEEWFREFGSDLRDEADYGFSSFEYSESSKSYVAWLEIDGQIFCDVNFWFEDKQMTKITISGKSDEGELNCIYIFSYN